MHACFDNEFFTFVCKNKLKENIQLKTFLLDKNKNATQNSKKIKEEIEKKLEHVNDQLGQSKKKNKS